MRMSWSSGQNAYKVVFLVGDAPPHMDYPNDVAYAETARIANSRHIVINTIQCGTLALTTPIWQQIATGGRGEYVAIRQDGAMVATRTPLDHQLARLNRELADTVLAYGDAPEQERILRGRNLALAAPPAVAAARLAYLDKTGGKANAGGGDLLDAVKEDRVDVATLPSEALPEPMRGMDEAERKAFVADRIAKRGALQRRISALAGERDDFLRAEAKRREAAGEAPGFDSKVLEVIRQQAAASGIRYE